MIVRLDSPAAMDVGLAGGKGAALAQLVARGHSVPPGLVITTGAFAAFCQQHAIPETLADIEATAAEQGEAWFQDAIGTMQAHLCTQLLPAELQAELDRALAAFDAGSLWAVRSSSSAEDSMRASFAGQYDTVLGVASGDEMAAAILHCWVSFFHPNALRYRFTQNIRNDSMALVAQCLVDADVAGVGFSINPASGDRDEVVLNANVGLGESVVGGLVTPDTIIARKIDGEVRSQVLGSKLVKTVRAPGGSREVETSPGERDRLSLTPAQVRQLVDLVVTIEREEGHAVDVEWAFVGKDVYLLQVRPVTAVAMWGAKPPDGPPPDWTPSANTAIDPRYPLHSNGNISEILPGCVSPLTWSRVSLLIDYAFTQQYFQLGVIEKEPDPEARLESLAYFYYRPYICISYFTETASAAPGLTPDIYLEEFVGKPVRKTPPLAWGDLHPRQVFKLLRLVSGFLANLLRNGRQVAACRDYIANLLIDLADEQIERLDTRQLLDKVAFNQSSGYLSLVHIWASSFASAGFAAVRSRTAQWLDDEPGTWAAGLVTGIGALPSAEPAFGLHELAQHVRGSSSLRPLFAEADDHQVWLALCASEDREAVAFRELFDEFLKRHGHRGICEAELMTECWRDDPAQVVGMVRNFLLPGATAPAVVQERQEEVRLAATHDALARLNPWRRLALTQLLRVTRHFIQRREELKDLITLREDRARRVFQCVAGRLQETEHLERADDIYFLTWREVCSLQDGTLTVAEASDLVARRRREFRWCQQLVMPKVVDGVAAPIELDTADAHRRLDGVGVYPGRVEGRARVILDPRVNAVIEPGEILVAPVTDAGWTPLFINAAGLVVEVGGLLSHGSVVAREYGLVSVVGAHGATRRIQTGDRILVDGIAGSVVVLDEGQMSP